jgi:opacity protein-like surface antigen
MKLRSLLALIVWLALSISPVLANDAAEKAADTAARAWLSQIDAGNYGKSWQDAASYFQGAISEKGWTDALTGARKPLGSLLSRKLSNERSTKSLPGAPDGNYVVMQFDTSFSNKKSAVETVTFVQEKDGKWKAAGYYIQ